MTDDLKQKMDGIYGWSVDGDKIQPPIHRFPKAVKDRADYFAEKTESNIIQLNLKEIKHSVTVFKPLLEISKLPFDEAKELMWKAYHHRLTEDDKTRVCKKRSCDCLSDGLPKVNTSRKREKYR